VFLLCLPVFIGVHLKHCGCTVAESWDDQWINAATEDNYCHFRTGAE